MDFASNWNESRGWLSRQSPRKLINAGNVWRTFHQSQLTGRLRIPDFPLSLSIEPTTSCNLRCPECPSGLRSFTRPTGNLHTGLFQNIIDELHPFLTNLTFYFQGEPFLHPHFLDMVSYASEKGVYQTTSTNAHFLDPESARAVIKSGLDRIIISVDGLTQETYEKYRIGGKLSKVIEGTRNLIEARKQARALRPFIVFQFLVVRHNEHEINALYQLAEDLGVDSVKIKTAQIYEYQDGSSLIPENPKYSRYVKGENEKWKIKSAWENKCWKMWSSSVVTWDGRVLPCCFDKDGKYVMGNLTDQSFASIWNGERYQQFRAGILNSRADIDICRNCSEGLKVWA